MSRVRVECPDYADAELGACCRLLLEGKRMEDIAWELDMSWDEARFVISRIRSIGRPKAERKLVQRPHPGPRHRPRSVTSEEEARIYELAAMGMTQARIAMTVHRPATTVRYILMHPREEVGA